MDTVAKQLLLDKAKKWFSEVITVNHIANTKKLVNSSQFNINPFLAVYLANFLTGNSEPVSIAKVLVYARVLGTSINTSFGTHVQSFTSNVLTSFGSTTSGIDIEFVDCLDKRKKYCQLKAGPNTINKDDVETIAGHFKSVINLGKTNNLRISYDDLVVGVIYGSEDELSGHYNRITSQYNYPVYIGANFWERLTGDNKFYLDIIRAIGEVAVEADFSKELDHVIAMLATDEKIKKLSRI